MEWILLVFVGIIALALIDEYRPRSRESEFRHLYFKWQQSCKKRGLSPAQQNSEFHFRCAWVRFRRKVNEVALTDPENYRAAISDIAKYEADVLAITDKRVAKQFLNVVLTSNTVEILYPDGLKVVMAHNKEAVKAALKMVADYKVTDDLLNALR